MSKILLHIQSLTMIDSGPSARNMALAFHYGRHTDHTLLLYTPTRCSIDRGRNEAAKIAMDAECDYLWFLDDDMIIDPSTLDSLLKADRDIVMAHSYIRGYPYRPMCFRYRDRNSEEPVLEYFEHDEDLYALADVNKLCDVAAVGFTCTMIKVALIKKINNPYFITNPHGGGTEDVYFCMRCKAEVGDAVSITVDLKCPTTHLGERELINADTVKSLRIYHETVNPEIIKLKQDESKIRRDDRSQEYHEQCLKV
jgi:GT2 family glycosyltransferase